MDYEAENAGQIRQRRKVTREVTLEECQKHNKRDDLWVVLNGRVYDVSKWTRNHPGGILPMLGCAGRDATEVFTGFHPDWVWTQKLPYFHIANLTAEDAKVQEQSIHYECVKDFRRIREQLMQEGLFQTNYWWYFRKFLWQLFLFISAISCTLLSTNLYVNLLGALLLGFFWQQVAFIGHDLCHNAVTHNRVVDTLIACVTTTLFGVSAEWWKRSHNTHHVVTNSLEHDPDIQHLPVFAISEKFFNNVYSFYHERVFTFDRLSKFLVSNQHILYYPVMTVARFNLYAQSFILHAKCVDYMAWKKVDLASLIFFWVWYVPMLMQLGSWQRAVAYLFLSHGVCALLHIQITISHFAMPVYEGSPYKDDGYEFIKTQLATSMDVDCPWYLDWLHGGLQFQVEHHLFPRLPRHNLRYVKDKYVVPFCKKWNIQYHQATFFEANMIVLNTLRFNYVPELKVINYFDRQAATKASLHSGFVASFNGDG